MKITFNGVELEVLATVTGGEPMVMYYPDGSGHPGAPPEVQIEEIIYEGIDVFDIYDSLRALDQIEEIVLDNYDPTY